MCGILGFYGEVGIEETLFSKALKLQERRGPDNSGILKFDDSIIGHNRLSIHDTSSLAHQPMIYDDGRYTLIFNGEIYNFRDLKLKLSGAYQFVSDSDTEVLLYSLVEYGIEKTLNEIEGMFAFSFHDRSEGKVFIARDRYGEKPLYYTKGDCNLSVSSSLYSLALLYGIDGFNKESISDFLHYGYTKGEDTPLNNVSKLLPGWFMIYDLKADRVSKLQYYNPVQEANFSSEMYSIKELDSLIRNSVSNCLDSDVKVGCFLSGGIDSSLISSYVSELSNDVEAFTIGFEDSAYDESDRARAVAQLLGLKVNVVKLGLSDFQDILEHNRWAFDEPFADASFLATIFLSQFARKEVTVCLSGDGGDELFCGYNRHVFVGKIYKKTKHIPYSVRVVIARILKNSSFFKNSLKWLYKVVYSNTLPTAMGEKLDKIGDIITYKDLDDLLFKVYCGNDFSSRLGLPGPRKPLLGTDFYRDVALLDLQNYLHEDVLTKSDRSSMCSSLEVRAPLLNSKIVNLALKSQDQLHIKDGAQKSALRDLLNKRMPNYPFETSKSGFSVPYKQLLELVDFKSRLSALIGIFAELDELLGNCIDICEQYFSKISNDYKLVWNIYCLIIWLENIVHINNDK
ncbi:asparagine synthase (glutamine-hydrolyzing) [Vibrio tritonius]|uniref:asparagine synthase (glutamine-hydrolyzing) n=1 Tax=Vibrio tritonius TaxID=1435069 RepID=A0ABS7YJ52_9VIBR|nr:asparagine synthase (glutamine-hydrolyzing) [Vibrio tritonius]MCA2015707.1 asparagine synthase (glutamine-hydrolyzing) [Vibrio tritonius]